MIKEEDFEFSVNESMLYWSCCALFFLTMCYTKTEYFVCTVATFSLTITSQQQNQFKRIVLNKNVHVLLKYQNSTLMC